MLCVLPAASKASEREYISWCETEEINPAPNACMVSLALLRCSLLTLRKYGQRRRNGKLDSERSASSKRQFDQQNTCPMCRCCVSTCSPKIIQLARMFSLAQPSATSFDIKPVRELPSCLYISTATVIYTKSAAHSSNVLALFVFSSKSSCTPAMICLRRLSREKEMSH
jgi:hypothetical protein